MEQPAYIRGVVHLATFTVHMDHFRIYRVRALECPERGLLIWAPTQIRLSMEGREAIKRGVERKLERAERFNPSEA